RVGGEEVGGRGAFQVGDQRRRLWTLQLSLPVALITSPYRYPLVDSSSWFLTLVIHRRLLRCCHTFSLVILTLSSVQPSQRPAERCCRLPPATGKDKWRDR